MGSPKCRVAILHDVPIMRPAWVDQVWKQVCIACLAIVLLLMLAHCILASLYKGSLNSMLKATDARFATLRCPTLYGLNVAVTGLSREERLEVRFILR